MEAKIVGAAAVFAALSTAPALAESASKADVQKVVDSIKGDEMKMAQFCELVKLEADFLAAADRKDEKGLEELNRKMDEATGKLGPDFEKVTFSEMDGDSAELMEGLGWQKPVSKPIATRDRPRQALGFRSFVQFGRGEIGCMLRGRVKLAERLRVA